MCQILTAVPGSGCSSKKCDSFSDDGLYPVRRFCVTLLLDVTPDFEEIERSLRRKNVAYAHLGLAFQFRQVSIQSIFGDSCATVELLDAACDLSIDCLAVFQEPAVLFFLGLQQAEQNFLDVAGTGRLKLLLDSGFEGWIVDFDVHDFLLPGSDRSATPSYLTGR